MEDILGVYHRPKDEHFPAICMDEASKQLLAEKREPLPMKPEKIEKIDYEYGRQGTCNIFAAVEPLEGNHFFKVTERRTKKDWAHFIREVIEEYYKHAERVILVLDHLNTHVFSSFYEAFPPEEARELVKKIEIHYTPKHASWLNMTEIELSALARQCLPERIETMQKVQEQIHHWAEKRNRDAIKINWRFTAEDARIKLKHLYPRLETVK